MQADDPTLPIMLTEYNIHTNYEWDMRPTTVDTPWAVRQPLRRSQGFKVIL